tara:strand:- start:36 stop:215 length:180 start_codon:yes stop_codon:yes gene_type:complete
MPKKKLTKTQVKKKFTTASNNVYDLVLDKFGHSDSRVSMSKPKLMEVLDLLQRAKERTK